MMVVFFRLGDPKEQANLKGEDAQSLMGKGASIGR